MADTFNRSTSTENVDLYRAVEFLPQVILGLFYIIHGIGSLSVPSTSIAMMTFIRISEPVGRNLVFIIGFVDMVVGFWILTIHRPAIADRAALLYAALWPVAPNILSTVLGLEFEAEFVLTSLLAIAIYYFQIKKNSFSDLLIKIKTYGQSKEQDTT